MKREKTIAIFLCGILILFYIYHNQLYQRSSVNLPWGIKRVRYKESSEKTYTSYGGSIDLYNADENDMKNETFVKYQRSFGYVKDERTAVDIATIVFHEVYKDCNKKETPFIIKYNENAGAWVVHGTLPFLHLGGVGSIAIKKETGEVLLLMHTK